MPKPAPKAKFVMLGKSKFVHVVHTAAYDRKNSECPQVRKYMVAGKIDYKDKGISPEAALSLDECDRCVTHKVAQSLIPAASKREAAKEARDEVMDRAKGGKKKTKAKVKSTPKAGGPQKERKPSMTKSGPRSVASRADGDPAQAKAKQLIEFAEEHGWSAKLSKDDVTGHWVVTAKRGDEVITAWYIDGKYDINRHAETRVGSWVGKLRGAHACRRQMAGEGRDRVHPEPGKGRTGPRAKSKAEDVPPEDESPEDAARRVPFLLDDDEGEILDALLGKVIRWRNGVSGSVEEATVPFERRPNRKSAKRDVVSISEHPKTHRRILAFLEVAGVTEDGEVYGPERSVALDKIVRVIG